jgi:hypothetical protein
MYVHAVRLVLAVLVLAAVAYPWVGAPLIAVPVVMASARAGMLRMDHRRRLVPPRSAVRMIAPIRPPTDEQRATWAAWADLKQIEPAAGLMPTPWPR